MAFVYGNPAPGTELRVRVKINVVIWKAPVEYDRKFSHHEEHEDHEAKTEHIVISSSWPSW